MEYALLYLILACIFGYFMAWGVGANDIANAMGTSVGAKAITLKQAIIIAAIFESAGALLAGGDVTDTIRSNVLDTSAFVDTPEIFIYGMLAALLSAGTWLLIASFYGLPVSTTHSIVGAIVGFGLISVGTSGIHWPMVTEIIMSWILTPVLAGIIAFILFRTVQFLILNSTNPLISAKRYIPFYIFLVVFTISMVTFSKGLKNLGFDLSAANYTSASVAIATLCTIIGIIIIRRLKFTSDTRDTGDPYDFTQVEKIFGILMIFTACSMAFAHGSNDVANAIGPLAAIIGVLKEGTTLAGKSTVPIWILLLGATGMVSGLAMYGYRVIATIGERITELTPSRGFAAELAAASTIIIASGTGLPISTTQTLVGAVLGIGLARGISSLRLNVVGQIFMSWLITLPAGALLAIIFFYILKAILL
ncbi:MAG: inorganic phosphate transporter [Gammaproteobacteria bacterium]